MNPNTATNTPSVDALDKLKDIHLPSDVPWWPLAPGWWILLALFFLMFALVIYLYIRSQRPSHQEIIIEQALELLDELQEQSLNPKALITELSALLRRSAISLYGREKVANLAGEKWLLFLDQYGATQAFSNGVGQAFADQPYRADVIYKRQALLALTQDWLKKQLIKTAKKKENHYA